MWIQEKGSGENWTDLLNVTNFTLGANLTSSVPTEKTCRLCVTVSSGVYAYSNEFTVTWRDPKDCVVSFDANGGSGGMSAQMVKEGDSCYLGACTITPPVGWGFQNWEVNGVPYAAGSTITEVAEDTTVKAVWQQVFTNMPVSITSWEGCTNVVTWTLDTPFSGKTLYLQKMNESTGEWNETYRNLQGYTSWTPTASDGSGTYRLGVSLGFDHYAYSDEFSVVWTEKPTVAAPVIYPPFETSFTESISVTAYCDTPGAVIYFTMDGTDPSTPGSMQYTGEFTIDRSYTIKAVARNLSTDLYSEIVSAEYTKVDSPAAPTASPKPGNFVGSTAVTLSCATNNTTIYYTTDGSEPVKGGGTSLIYSSPIAISADTTIKARAYLATDPNIYSGVAEFTYTKVTGYSVSGKVASYNGKNDFTVTLYETGTSTEKGKVTVTGTGASGQATQDFTLTGVASGTYDLVVTKAGHLTYTITGVVVGSENLDLTGDTSKAYSTITLLCGDVDGDGNINESDVSVIRYASNINKPVSSAANPLADVDGDGNVNESDVSIVRYAVHINKNTGHCTFVYAG